MHFERVVVECLNENMQGNLINGEDIDGTIMEEGLNE